MTRETGEKRIINGFDNRVLELNRRVHKPQGSAQVTQANIASLGLLTDQELYLNVELQYSALVLLIDT